MTNDTRTSGPAPLPGVDARRLEAIALELSRSATNIRSKGYIAGSDHPLLGYCRWANEGARQLGFLVSSEQVERLVLTPRYRLLQQANQMTSDVVNLVYLELEERARALDALASEMAGLAAKWNERECGQLVIADTNFYLHSELEYDHLNWHALLDVPPHYILTLVVPLLVIDELDRAKRGETRTRARTALRSLHSRFENVDWNVPLVDGNTRARLLFDPVGHIRLRDADAELVDRTSELQTLTGLKAMIVTYDIGMSLRAKAAGVTSRWFEQPASDKR
jgi:hypothetical protein